MRVPRPEAMEPAGAMDSAPLISESQHTRLQAAIVQDMAREVTPHLAAMGLVPPMVPMPAVNHENECSEPVTSVSEKMRLSGALGDMSWDTSQE